VNNQIQRGGFVRLFVFLLVCVGIAVVLSPWIYLGMQSLAASTQNGFLIKLAGHPFHRYFNRVLQVSMILGFWKVFKSTGFASIDALGLRSRSKMKHFAVGAVFSLFFLAVYVVCLLGADIYFIRETFVASSLFKIVISILGTALAVSFLEELFFRGFLYQLCRREWGIQKALIFNCVFFAAVHFLKPPSGLITSVDGFSGFKLLGFAFYQFASTQFIPYFLLLVLLTCMLCWTLEATKNLWLAIGIHAGLILGIQVFGEISRYSSTMPQWYFGGGDLKDGVASWIPLAIQFAALYLWLHRSRRRKPS
jgi:uncharacterized protein